MASSDPRKLRVSIFSHPFATRRTLPRVRLSSLGCIPAEIAILIASFILAGCTQGAGPADAQTPATAPVTYIGQWGAKGSGPGQLDDPTCITTDALGNVYIADAGSHFVDKFGPTGVPHLSFRDFGLKSPQSIAVDSGGAIYVTDASRGTVTIYLPSGIRLRSLRRRLRINAENKLDVSVDDDGLIYLFDSEVRRVFTYTARFRLIRVWQPSANVPNEQVRTAAMTGGPDGSLYFIDPAGNRILHFTGDGHFISEINAGANASGGKLSDEIAVSSQYVFAMDQDGRTLHIWRTNGTAKTDVDLGPELGQGNRPAPPIAASPSKELLVLDASEGRVLRYHTNF
jgi:DNA-binding beta-propeller fold protein YncE